MITLIASEWERLWSRKITWLLFASIPVILFATGSYYQNLNEKLDPSRPEYAVMGNFPVLALSEQLVTVLNLFLLLLLVFSITEEYRTGQIRMVMIRSYSFAQILWSKWFSVMGIAFLFHILYFVLSYLFGAMMFDTPPKVHLFYHNAAVSSGSAFSYNIRYYGFAFLTLIAMSWVITFIAVISKTTTTAIGMSVGFLMLSYGYPVVLMTFTRGLQPSLAPEWYFLSLTEIQYQGIALALAETPKLLGFNLLVLLSYTLLFGSLAYFIFTRKDRFI
jgi:ABC-2 type transport system permease protein